MIEDNYKKLLTNPMGTRGPILWGQYAYGTNRMWGGGHDRGPICMGEHNVHVCTEDHCIGTQDVPMRI